MSAPTSSVPVETMESLKQEIASLEAKLEVTEQVKTYCMDQATQYATTLNTLEASHKAELAAKEALHEEQLADKDACYAVQLSAAATHNENLRHLLDSNGISVPTQHVYVPPKTVLTKRKRNKFNKGRDEMIKKPKPGAAERVDVQEGGGELYTSPLGRKLCTKWMLYRKCFGGEAGKTCKKASGGYHPYEHERYMAHDFDQENEQGVTDALGSR